MHHKHGGDRPCHSGGNEPLTAPAVVMYRRVCLHATGANPRKELSPASAGFFRASGPLTACNQPCGLALSAGSAESSLPPGETASPI